MAKAYKNLKRDASHEPMQVAKAIQTYDATAVAQASPLAYSSNVVTIAIPTTAAEMVCRPTTNMEVSELVAMGSYFTVEGGVTTIIPCANTDTLYIKRESADGSLHFYFHLVN